MFDFVNRRAGSDVRQCGGALVVGVASDVKACSTPFLADFGFNAGNNLRGYTGIQFADPCQDDGHNVGVSGHAPTQTG